MDLVICNGGAGSLYQALSAGVPVIGLAANMDQCLAMGPVERAGAGRRVLSSEARRFPWKKAIEELLDSSQTRENAQRLAAGIQRNPSARGFRMILDEILDPSKKVS
jgi:UDP:flavonoid glycosyltransferase YjiC (YdhE family)